MTASQNLRIVKIVHTVIWVFFNIVIFFFLYSVITDQLGLLAWLCLALIAIEAAVLLYFRNTCPLTVLARKYSASQASNFDIYLPEWLAKYNKLIYSLIVGCALMIIVIRQI